MIDSPIDNLKMNENELAHAIIGVAINVHKILGSGLTRSTYISCIRHELVEHGYSVETNLNMPVLYKNVIIESALQIDILVENKVIVQLKTSEKITENHSVCLLNTLMHSELKLGLLLNFNSKYLKGDAIKRVINGQVYPSTTTYNQLNRSF